MVNPGAHYGLASYYVTLLLLIYINIVVKFNRTLLHALSNNSVTNNALVQ